ncbi:MAG: DMT family transporter [Boseongicola sp.]|nr:DMT family transporter [Boseongicola sp.]
MVAFASNSILNRWGLLDGETGPAAFQALRVLAGALCLGVLLYFRGNMPKLLTGRRLVGTGSLMAYMLGFSFAYVALDAGVGALILFGGVQVTMFAGALLKGERPPALRWVGAAVAFGGLIWLLWPGAVGAPPLGAALMMGIAAVAWGVYSLAGRGATDPMAETGANFICSIPLAVLAWLIVQDGMSASGAILAIVCGAVTSGLGYALWYTVLPKLDAAVAALTQLTVPVIAVVGGVIVLGEVASGRLILASAVVLGGVALGVLGGQRKSGSKAS